MLVVVYITSTRLLLEEKNIFGRQNILKKSNISTHPTKLVELDLKAKWHMS